MSARARAHVHAKGFASETVALDRGLLDPPDPPRASESWRFRRFSNLPSSETEAALLPTLSPHHRFALDKMSKAAVFKSHRERMTCLRTDAEMNMGSYSAVNSRGGFSL